MSIQLIDMRKKENIILIHQSLILGLRIGMRVYEEDNN